MMNGIEADTENFIAAQTYPGATPSIGFEGPVIYMLGNSGNYADYYRDVLCGNDANPTGGPDGAAALPGWDQASGFGAIDWLHYSTGYAQRSARQGSRRRPRSRRTTRGPASRRPATRRSTGSRSRSRRSGYAVGTSTTTPWFSTYLPSGSWGATNTFVKTTNGGQTWVPSNADMLDIACTSSTNCVEVGDGGVIKLDDERGHDLDDRADRVPQSL